MKNILYYPFINYIGGIESFIYYLAKKYQSWDITVYHQGGNPDQLKRLAEYVRVKHYAGEKIKCEKAIFNYRTDIIDNVEAEEYIQVVHCDFEEATKIGYPPNINPKITRYLAVSENVKSVFKRLTGIDAELCYNPIKLDKQKKVLNLISATRLTAEKGKNRMIKLANMMDAAGIPYLWTVFTTDKAPFPNPNVVYRKPRLDVVDFIANADYLVQLSDTEGYPYSILESLAVGTPVIVTDLPVLKEMGVEHGKNGFIIDFEMKNVPLEAIYEGLQAFTYNPNKDRWGTIMAKGKSTYKKEKATLLKVQPIQEYYDLQLEKLIKAHDDPFEVDSSRAEYLEGLGLVKVLEGDIGVK